MSFIRTHFVSSGRNPGKPVASPILIAAVQPQPLPEITAQSETLALLGYRYACPVFVSGRFPFKRSGIGPVYTK